MPLKCFIAMAFDHGDTDKVYDKAIEPLLKKHGVIPFRVDRSNRNDDIDDQILAELGKCDFAIADLTYARPSVYFEAGVAHGSALPVIYTCRRDHFKHQPDDHHGNYRVHFDLQMKPVIKWDQPLNASFLEQLEKRLKHVITPLIIQRQQSNAFEKQKAIFAGLPLNEKTELLGRIYRNTIKRHAFKGEKDLYGVWKAQKPPKMLKWVDAHFSGSFSRKDIGYYVYSYTRGIEFNLKKILTDILPVEKKLPQQVSSELIFCSVQAIAVSRVSAALPSYRIHKTGNIITAEHDSLLTITRCPKGKNVWDQGVKAQVAEVMNHIRINIISGIKYEAGFKIQLNEIINSGH